MERSRFRPSRRWSLAWRSLLSHAAPDTLLALSIAFAVAATLIAGGLSRSIVRSTEADAERYLASAYALLPQGIDRVPAGTAELTGGWLSAEAFARFREILASERLVVSAGLAGSAFLLQDGVSSPLRFFTGPDGVNMSPDSVLLQFADLVIPIVGPPDARIAPLYISCRDAGIPWALTELDLALVDEDALRSYLISAGVMDQETVGNVVTIETAQPATSRQTLDSSSSAIAYNAQELLRSEFPAVVVQPRRNFVDGQRELSVENLTLLLRLLASLPALAAIVGGVLVAGESRAREFTLLRTLGYTHADLRGAVVREVFVVSVMATAGAAVIASMGCFVLTLPLATGNVIRTTMIGVLAPPLIAFLAARRSLERPLAPQLAADTAGEEP